MRIYFDTSALAKRYKPEQHSSFVNEVLSSTEHKFYILSIISEVEMRSTLHRFLIDQHFQKVWNTFVSETKQRFDVVTLDQDIKYYAYEIMANSICKTLDALHIAAAAKLGQDVVFLTFDKQQAKAAQACGLRLLTPE